MTMIAADKPYRAQAITDPILPDNGWYRLLACYEKIQANNSITAILYRRMNTYDTTLQIYLRDMKNLDGNNISHYKK
jgi:hypothetical protein